MAEDRSVSRREFLKLAGLTGATIGVGAGLGGIIAACGGGATTTTTAAGVTTTTGGATTTGAGVTTTAGGVTTTAASNVTGTVSLIMLGSNKPGGDLVIADFQKVYPGVTIKPNFIADIPTYTTSVPAQFAAGNGSDLVMLLGGRASPNSVAAYAKAGLIADQSSASWVPKMYPPTKPLFEFDGKVLAMDFGFSPLAILSYNKDIFAKYSLKIPATFAELVDVCKQLVGKGIIPISWGGGSPVVNTNNVATIAGGTVFAQTPDWLQQRLDGTTTFAATPGWRRALEMLSELHTAKAFAPGVEGVSLQDMVAQFAQAKTAMMCTYGGLNGLVLKQTPNLNIGMFMIPADEAANSRITVQAAGGLALWVKSQNKDAANAFLDFLSGDAELLKFATANNLLTGAEASSGQLGGTYAELNDAFKAGLAIPDPTANWPNTSMTANSGASIQGLFTGQKSIDQVLADMDTFFNAK